MSRKITGHTRLVGIVATPIRHSKSPIMHNTAFELLGLDYAYLAFDFPRDSLEDAVKGLRALGARGWNVSMPYKTEIIPMLDEISEISRLCRSVNTVVNENGKLYGTVTDGIGYMDALKDEGVDILGKKITVLGAGAAASAICLQAAMDGVTELALFTRRSSTARGESLAAVIRENTSCRVTVRALEDEDALRGELKESVLLTNATNVGMGALEGQSLITDAGMLHRELAVSDIIYAPEETALLRLAREAGCRTMNGLGMVLWQGAASFKLWTGMDMPVEAVKQVI